MEWPKAEPVFPLRPPNGPKGKILRLPLTKLDLTNATTVSPEGTNVLQSFQPAASGLWMVLLKGGRSEVVFVDFFGKSMRVTNDQTLTAVQQLLVTQGDEVMYRTETYTDPPAW